ncbi:phage major capsid protein [Staphylococcus simulans]|uniref:phage major capsid protein n=1 Tax=Staphylococcus simulans TaxID=1286 RepID=UPI000D1F19B3|nr:phage major capsid protein [Staphylococcus simulans]PTJ91643.1 phage major capsid protein [Staphylococcus simulans]
MATPKYTPDHVLLSEAKTGVIPQEQGNLILKDMVNGSAIMKLAKGETMTMPKKSFTYLAKGIGAYWVSETERIQTAKPQYLTAEMEAKKLGVIIPLSKEFLRYTAKDFFNEVKPLIAEAFYQKFDNAVLFGTETPYGESGKAIFTGASEAGNVIAQTGDLYNNLNDVMALIEDEDYDPNGILTTRSFKKDLRGAVDGNNQPIFDGDNEALGLPIAYTNKAGFDKTKAAALLGDWDYARYGILQGIEYSISEDATLTTLDADDASGKPVSLFERDMFALRATMHIGYMNVKPEAFGALTPASQPAETV